uniref:DUF148 domain-containing protein n=1 Tax=Loa loa TaxID=7209 RepID=A0A1I7VLE9_LOALO
MRSLKFLAVCFIFVDTTKSLEGTVKQFTTDSGQWNVAKNGLNVVDSQHQLSDRFNVASIINLLSDIMQILNRNRSNLASPNQYKRQSPLKMNWNLKRYVELVNATNDHNQKRQPLTHLDTGGSNFDRFIVSERKNDNPVLDWIVGKFIRRGLDWSNGNLRLVNIQVLRL